MKKAFSFKYLPYFLTFVFASMFALMSFSPLYAKNTAIIIGVSENSKIANNTKNLPFCYNDAIQIAETLLNAGYHIELLTQAPSDNYKRLIDSEGHFIKMIEPTQENILAKLNEILTPNTTRYLNSEDTALVYFSGHGTKFDASDNVKTSKADPQQEEQDTFLVTADSDITRQETLITAHDIREILSHSPAGHKLLILDACHSAGTRGFSNEINFEDFIRGGESDVLTFSSCTLSQSSGIWEEQEMSAFTYWLHQGLLGFADGFTEEEPDGQISTEELFCYIRENMKQVKSSNTTIKNGDEQNPQIVQNKSYEEFKEDLNNVLLTISSPRMNLDNLLDAFANQIAARLQENAGKINDNTDDNYNLDFKVAEKDKNDDDNAISFSATIKSCSPQEETQTCSLYKSIRGKLKNNLEQKKLKIGDHLRKINIIDSGNVNNINSTNASLECNLNYHSNNTDPYYEMTCELFFHDSSSKSSVPVILHNTIRADDFNKNPDAETIDQKIDEIIVNEGAPGEIIEISASMNDPSKIVHFQIPDISFEVTRADQITEIRYPKKDRQGVLWLELNSGESYKIRIHYSVPYPLAEDGCIGLRLLVDGKNTLADNFSLCDTKFIALAPIIEESSNHSSSASTNQTANSATSAPPASHTEKPLNTAPEAPALVSGASVRLEKARWWVLRPQESVINGFYNDLNHTSDGTASYNRFEVISFDGKIASNEHLDQIGLILAAFYPLELLSRGITADTRTVAGEVGHQQLKHRTNLRLDEYADPIGVVQIRYASSAAINRYFAEQGIGQDGHSQKTVSQPSVIP